MSASKMLIVEYLESEKDSSPSDFETFYLEYELYSQRGGNCFATLDGVQMIVVCTLKWSPRLWAPIIQFINFLD